MLAVILILGVWLLVLLLAWTLAACAGQADAEIERIMEEARRGKNPCAAGADAGEEAKRKYRGS